MHYLKYSGTHHSASVSLRFSFIYILNVVKSLQNAAGLIGRTEKGQCACLKREVSLLYIYKKKKYLGKGSGGEH